MAMSLFPHHSVKNIFRISIIQESRLLHITIVIKAISKFHERALRGCLEAIHIYSHGRWRERELDNHRPKFPSVVGCV